MFSSELVLPTTQFSRTVILPSCKAPSSHASKLIPNSGPKSTNPLSSQGAPVSHRCHMQTWPAHAASLHRPRSSNVSQLLLPLPQPTSRTRCKIPFPRNLGRTERMVPRKTWHPWRKRRLNTRSRHTQCELSADPYKMKSEIALRLACREKNTHNASPFNTSWRACCKEIAPHPLR